jgi:signal transduction histidine kinase
MHSQSTEIPKATRHLHLLSGLKKGPVQHDSSANVRTALASVDSKLGPLLKLASAHLTTRFNNLNKMLKKRKLKTLTSDSVDSDGKVIPESSKLYQHIRALRFSRQILGAASVILVIELHGGESKQHWQRIKSILKGLREPFYLSKDPAKRKRFDHALGQLDLLTKDLRQILSQEQGAEHFSKEDAKRHAAILAGLATQFHTLNNRLAPFEAYYEMVHTLISEYLKGASGETKFIRREIKEKDLRNLIKRGFMYQDTEGECVKPEQVVLELREFFRGQTQHHREKILEADKHVELLSSRVARLQKILRKKTFRDLIMAAGLAEHEGGPASVIDFNLSHLETIFRDHLTGIGDNSVNIKLRLNIEPDVTRRITLSSHSRRTLIGCVFNNLILNAIQALDKVALAGESRSVEINGFETKQNKKNDDSHYVTFEVVTKGITIPAGVLSKIRYGIEHPKIARRHAGLAQGGTGMANVTTWLSDREFLDGTKPTIANTGSDLVIAFKIKCPR